MDPTLLPLIIGVAALLLIASGIALWMGRRREAPRAHSTPERHTDDLRSLGIVDIRPLERAVEPSAETPQAPVASPEKGAAAEDVSAEDLSAEAVGLETHAAALESDGPVVQASAADRSDTDKAEVAATEAEDAPHTAPVHDAAATPDMVEASGTEARYAEEGDEAEPSHADAVEVPDEERSRTEREERPNVVAESDEVLGDEVRSALAASAEEELGAAIAEVESASERIPRPEDLVEEDDDFFFGPDDLDPAALDPVRLPDPRDFEEGLDLPMPLPGDDIALVRRPPSRALAHLVEAIWTSLRAQTVAVLRHDASALAYVVEALKSEHADVVGVERFASAGSALRTVFGAEPTLLRGANLDALGYYANPDAIGRAYVQPLTQEDAPSLLLVVDLAPGALGFTAAEKYLLRHFASLFGHLAEQEVPQWFSAPPADPLLDLPAGPPGAEAAEPTSRAFVEEALAEKALAGEPSVEEPSVEEPLAETSEPVEATDTVVEGTVVQDTVVQDTMTDDIEAEYVAAFKGRHGGKPVARRVIVAEEMARARARQHPLALALIHHTEAEPLAELGPDAVAEVDTLLREHLEHSLALADGRLEPFGELLYGVFYYGRAADIEAWVELVRTTPARTGETLPLTIGVALYQDRHQTSDQFRADAVQALADAYDAQVGCVILE